MPAPDFDTIYETSDAEMLKDAYAAITKCELWDWFKSYSPEEGRGFMFSSHPNLERISAAMMYDGHSGSSYGWTMRVMENIAKKGWTEHKNEVRQSHAARQLEHWAREQRKSKGNPCPCRYAQGYTDGWCGVAGGGVPGCDH